jgi:hypothetical protein
MSIGSISSNTVSTTIDKRGESTAPAVAKTVADHVVAADDQEPIRSASTTLGTLIDTYL